MVIAIIVYIWLTMKGDPEEGDVKTKTCPGGEEIITHEYIDGEWVFTGMVCPAPAGDENFWEIFAIDDQLIKFQAYSPRSDRPDKITHMALVIDHWEEDLLNLYTGGYINNVQHYEMVNFIRSQGY